MATKKDTLEIHVGCDECVPRQEYAEWVYSLLCQNCTQNFDQIYRRGGNYYGVKQAKQENKKKVAKCLGCIHRQEFYVYFYKKVFENCQKCHDKIMKTYRKIKNSEQ